MYRTTLNGVFLELTYNQCVECQALVETKSCVQDKWEATGRFCSQSTFTDYETNIETSLESRMLWQCCTARITIGLLQFSSEFNEFSIVRILTKVVTSRHGISDNWVGSRGVWWNVIRSRYVTPICPPFPQTIRVSVDTTGLNLYQKENCF